MPFLISEFFAAGYRSLKSITLPVGQLSVFLGTNGVGKTNLYRALQLIQASATGTLSYELSSEGGMESAMWAGKRLGGKPPQITIGASFREPGARDSGPTGTYRYELSVGFPPSRADKSSPIPIPTGGAFPFEPEVKEESLSFDLGKRSSKLLDRKGPSVTAIDNDGESHRITTDLMLSETALGSIREPAQFPDLYEIRRVILDWRFYHGIRTDARSALRQPCLAVATPTLASDGSNLAAVFATLVHIHEDRTDLDSAVEDAFPGAKLDVPRPGRTASFGMIFPDYPERVFDAAELSDGTLQYLALVGALLSPRLPVFLALNEPEASLHPDLLDPLARLIVQAAERTQVWLVTHSERLAAAIEIHGRIRPRTVIKRDGATWVDGLTMGGEFNDD